MPVWRGTASPRQRNRWKGENTRYNTLDDLLSGEAVPREVVKLVAEYRKGRGKRPPRLLSSTSRPDVDALFKARGGPE